MAYNSCNYNKRKRLVTQPNWSDLHPELLDLVLEKLSFADKLRFQGVCSSWLSISKTHISVLSRKAKSQPPLLMFPSNPISGKSSGRSFFNVEENKLLKVKNLPNKFDRIRCFGSSEGWLVFLDKDNKNHYLFNPFFEATVKVQNVKKLSKLCKVILWADPINDDKYGIVAIDHVYLSPGIFYVKSGDNELSTLDDGVKRWYFDIVSCGNLVYALTWSLSVEIWDFSTSIPTKVDIIEPCFHQESFEGGETLENCDTIFYLIEYRGELFLVKRYRGNHVSVEDNVVVSEEDMEDMIIDGCEFRYLTMLFHVYKLNVNKKEWVKVDDLGDNMIFLGGNMSVMVRTEDLKEYQKNSIYFTDDNWGLMYLDNDAGGHDMGIYNLKDHSPQRLFDPMRIRPPPYWLAPRSM